MIDGSTMSLSLSVQSIDVCTLSTKKNSNSSEKHTADLA